MNLKKRTNTRFCRIGALSGILLLIFSIAGCGLFVKKNIENEENFLTINRLWRMHDDVNYVYFYYEDGSVESGLILRWDKEKIEIQKKGESLPEFIPSQGVKSVKVVIGNRIWQSLAAGSALAAGFFVLVGAGDLGGESPGSAAIKMFGAPLIIMASVAFGASSEKTETYEVPDNFEFDFDEIKRIREITK
ncbi:MAG: hypothetical protein JSU85_06455 [Candidatus Zixiibacteriota bacterium]|nr:MAG: hypothetical protein JSU85_06455 [candidate division Zixibacteria bacterium]